MGRLFAEAGATGASSWGQQAGRMHCSGAMVGLSLRRVGARAAP
jgi:hypothetical protein